jgi:hypothetical protein
MAASAMLIPFMELASRGLYWSRVSGWLDNPSYIDIAHILRFGGTPMGPHFWGFPAVIALTEAVFSTTGLVSLVLVAFVSSALASVLIFRLYGPIVTVMFMVLSPEWVRLSIVGGSEPLFLLLLLGSWLAFRADRILLAVLLASLATTVRSVGAIAVCAFALTLLLQRDWRRLAMSFSIAVGVGLTYLGWLRAVCGDPFINFRRYSASDWPSGNPFSIPFVALVKGLIRMSQIDPWTRLAQPMICIAILGFGVFALLNHARNYAEKYPAELSFVVGYLGFFLCYGYQDVAWFLTRFMIPVYPFLLFAGRDWLPNSRIVLWMLVLASSLIASADLVGFNAAFGVALHR